MHTKTRTMAWILFLIWFVPGLAFAEKMGRLIGKVVDPEGKPIEGVAVTVTSQQLPKLRDVETTDKKGVFIVDFRQIDVTYHYRFDKAGFQSMEADQKWSLEGTEHFQWTMHPGTSAPVVGDVPAASTSQEAIAAYNTGISALRIKDYPKAAENLAEAVKHDPKLRQAWAALSSIHLELGQNQEAADAAEKAIELGSTDESVLVSRWQAYRNLKNDAKAAEALKDLEKVGRRTEEAKKIHNDAVALSKQGDYAGAFAKFQEALAVDPNLQVSLLGLATAALKIGKPLEAATAAETILKTDPKNEKAIRIRYNACLALGDKARLADALVGLAAFEPVMARNGLWAIFVDAWDANDMALAKERIGKVLQVDPNYPQAYYYLAVINLNQDASAEAKSNLERFLQLAPNDPNANSARQMLKELANH